MLAVTGSGSRAIESYSNSIDPLLEVESPKVDAPEDTRVTAVYGLGAEDYLPMKESARRQLRPHLRESGSRVAFDLPDAFYFIGGPVFLLIFLRVLVIFLNGFEEARKEEMRLAASEHLPGERFAGD